MQPTRPTEFFVSVEEEQSKQIISGGFGGKDRGILKTEKKKCERWEWME